MPKKWTPDYICGRCFSDDGLKDFIESYAQSKSCSFCGARSKRPIAAPLRDVLDHIASCIGEHYDDPANTLPYESAEGGYQGATYTTDEMFEELELEFPNDSDGRLHDAISGHLENDLWSEADPFALTPTQHLEFSWDEFCRVIKHDRRYFFAHKKRGKHSELYNPSEVLRLIFSYAREAGAFVTMPRGTVLFRARYQGVGQKFASAGTLGPPPVEYAIQTNRMSPPGIVMTYASNEKATALAETAASPGTYAIGEFVTKRNALILDLTRLPPVPSIFAELPDTLEYDPRPRLSFLHRISFDISRPIARDDRVHIEYVPTQVVTEYVRTAVAIKRKRVDGIRYKSSRRIVGTSLVLFADQTNLVLEKQEQTDFYSLRRDRWLDLKNTTVRRVAARDIRRWTRGPAKI